MYYFLLLFITFFTFTYSLSEIGLSVVLSDVILWEYVNSLLVLQNTCNRYMYLGISKYIQAAFLVS